MPTGYTSPIADGEITTLRQYAIRCARAFGACVTMRDEPLDAALPERFEPNLCYHDEELANALKLIEELPSLSIEECEIRANEEYEYECKWRKEYTAKSKEQKSRYEKMIEVVLGWDIPSGSELFALKRFMIEQLEQSIKFDCCDYMEDAPAKLDGESWRAKKLEKAQHDRVYHQKKIDEEIARTEHRNAWLKLLRESLPPE